MYDPQSFLALLTKSSHRQERPEKFRPEGRI